MLLFPLVVFMFASSRVFPLQLCPLSLSPPSISLLLLLVTSSCASYSRQVCFICITNQPRASENLRKATYFTFLYHLPPSISLLSSPRLLSMLSFTLYPPAFLHTCKPRISLTVLRDCLLAALTLPASSFRIRIQKSSLHINPASLFPLSPFRTSFSFSHVAIKNHSEKKETSKKNIFYCEKIHSSWKSYILYKYAILYKYVCVSLSVCVCVWLPGAWQLPPFVSNCKLMLVFLFSLLFHSISGSYSERENCKL